MYKIGDRISVSNELCIVKYVGYLEEWPNTTAYGLEWDREGRGKHSGSINGNVYFQTSVEGAGSFIKEDKLQREVQPSRTFFEALSAKYGDILNDINEIHLGSKKVESFGFEKLGKKNQDFKTLKNVSLDHLLISGASISDEELRKISANCQNITDLHLSFNLFSDINEANRILKELPSLHTLDLTGNRFLKGWDVAEPIILPNIKQLNVSSCGLSIEHLKTLLVLFPCLEVLNASFNDIGQLTHEDIRLPASLKELSISGCSLDGIPYGLAYWNLRTLNLSENNIAEIRTQIIDSLDYLDISRNKINDWTVVDRLNINFPSLSSLRINHNPLFNQEERKQSYFYELLARIDNINTLNGSNFEDSIRKEAELYFLSKLAEGEIKYDITLQRYHVLTSTHGVTSNLSTTPPSSWLEEQIISINILHTESSTSKNIVILSSYTVRHLKGIVSKLFQMNVLSISLFRETTYGSFELLSRDFSELNDYGIQKNDSIFIEMNSNATIITIK